VASPHHRGADNSSVNSDIEKRGEEKGHPEVRKMRQGGEGGLRSSRLEDKKFPLGERRGEVLNISKPRCRLGVAKGCSRPRWVSGEKSEWGENGERKGIELMVAADKNKKRA